MFKASIIPVLVFAASHTEFQTKLDLFKGDLPAGSGTYTEKFDRSGHKTSTFLLKGREVGGVDRTVHQIKVIDGNAFPISEEETIIEKGPKGRYELILKVRYDSTGAAILDTTEDKYKTTTRSYVPLAGYSLADESDLWFSKTHPKAGTTVRSTVFDIENSGWQRIETTYIGKKWITVDGHRLNVHEVRDVRDGVMREVYLDDKGQPVLMKSGQFRTEKRF